MPRDIPWWVNQGNNMSVLYEDKCGSCGTELFVNRRKPRVKYNGPDSLDFSSSRTRVEEMVRAGTLYTIVYDTTGYSNGKMQMLEVGLCSQRFSICKECGSEGERLVKLHIIKQWVKEENASIKDYEKDLKEHAEYVGKKMNECKMNLKKLVAELGSLKH